MYLASLVIFLNLTGQQIMNKPDMLPRHIKKVWYISGIKGYQDSRTQLLNDYNHVIMNWNWM